MAFTHTILEALFPVIALVIAGYVFRKSSFLPDLFWDSAETLTFYVLFPSLILFRLLNADFSALEVSPLIITCITFFAVITAISWLCDRKLMNLEHATWTSFLQGSIRYNTFIALALADKLFGPELFTVSALLVGIFIIVVNIITVIAFSLATRTSALKLVNSIFKNPLIIACVAGIGINLSGLTVPGFINETLSVFGRAALPLALLAVGAGLHIKSLQYVNQEIIVSSVIKLMVAPIIMSALVLLLIQDHRIRDLLILFASLPTASAAYIMARKMGGNAQLMASIITFQTIISVVTVTIVLLIII